MTILHFAQSQFLAKRPEAVQMTLEECLSKVERQGFTRDSIERSLSTWGYVSSSEIGHFVVDGFEPQDGLPVAYLRLKNPGVEYRNNGEVVREAANAL